MNLLRFAFVGSFLLCFYAASWWLSTEAWSMEDGCFQGEGELSTGLVRRHGRLRVEGTQLVDQSSRPIQLRGMSSHGIRWFPQYTNTRAMLDLKRRGANLFRVAMYSDSVEGGYNQSDYDREISFSLMSLAVENALAADVYVIIDWHLLKDENPLPTVDSAVEFFDAVSARYADEPAVLYEICNEPNGPTTWEDIRLYAEKVIPAIRKNAPNAVILVGTPRFSIDILAPAASPLPYDNIMYSFHMYTGYTNYDFYNLLDSARRIGLPVFVTEWGISNDTDTGELDTEEGLAFIGYMREHEISWAYWSLCNTPEEFSVLKPETTRLSNWDDDDLSRSGAIIFQAFRGE